MLFPTVDENKALPTGTYFLSKCVCWFVCFVLFCFLILQLRLFLYDIVTPTTEKSDLADQVTACSENRGAGVNRYRLSQLR